MDMNELYFVHQAELMRASAAGDSESRQNHFDKVDTYAEQIRAFRDSLRRAGPIEPIRSDHTIDGNHAGTVAPAPPSPLASWDNEGGAIAPSGVTHTSGRTALTVPPRFFVGTAEYSNLTDVIDAHARQKLGG